ncbi:MAG: hypothetical protein VB087_07875 [Candidatus Limiplasma sp.]|nr:hypothetical protein [Candidatus Limiplasma sp.]
MNEHLLANAVIKQAAADWRSAIEPTNPKKKGFVQIVYKKRTRLNELRRFFRGRNADIFSGGQARVILARLEDEYKASRGRLQIEAYERGEIG